MNTHNICFKGKLAKQNILKLSPITHVLSSVVKILKFSIKIKYFPNFMDAWASMLPPVTALFHQAIL